MKMDYKTIVLRSMEQMHIRAIEAELREMKAGEIEYLKQEYGLTAGDINCLARFMWQQYQRV